MTTEAKLLFTTTSDVHGGRTGQAFIGRDRLNVTLRPPHARTEGTDPEELFAAGYASCFLSALQSVARRDGVTIGTPQGRAHVSLHTDASGGYSLGVKMQVFLPGTPHDTATQLLHAAHAVCPYSRAVAGNVDVQLEVLSAPL
ncbi:Ohr family peroxiredoxin (plasmid) [Deinococcus taeanensis]|uniref:Ohr family peroxiredoxin n=1 Tax=Deinococcus taeanensis TaxID=2737050 RepID=UPI001CDD10C2|nr:Ohr family peroxiredoxin [Deinococcus taeanensis]UBV44986.1 Ohr family peroxiredoxin [Deinococcus taeanensis]